LRDDRSGALPGAAGRIFRISLGEREAKSVSNPVGSVRVDVDVILQAIHASAYLVSGLVYDVDTGLVETVVPSTPLTAR
jgi:carbonic anhydrase